MSCWRNTCQVLLGSEVRIVHDLLSESLYRRSMAGHCRHSGPAKGIDNQAAGEASFASRWSSGQLTHDRQRDRSCGWFAETTAAVLDAIDTVFARSNISEDN
jgi:hypothetical protein